MPVPQSKPPAMFDHSSDGNEGDCHGRGQVLDRHGAFHRPIASVFYPPETVGTGSGCGPTRVLRARARIRHEVGRSFHRATTRKIGRPALIRTVRHVGYTIDEPL